MISVGHGRFSDAIHTKSSQQHQISKVTYQKDQIVPIMDQMYMVESQSEEDVFYTVDMKSNYCECPAGRNKGCCKHKLGVMKFFNEAEVSVIPVTDPRA